MSARKSNPGDRTMELCVPSAICVTRRRAPITMLKASFGGGEVFQKDGFLETGIPLVVLDLRNRGPDILVEVLTPTGDTRWVLSRYLRFNSNSPVNGATS